MEGEAVLRAFVQHPPHVRLMAALALRRLSSGPP